ncbi:MAG TPA: ribosome maturation factor RimP [Alphaproteobacteria bacterium]|nr:ribosome maturation factor RimP [Alphaproteobacteria bacterium]
MDRIARIEEIITPTVEAMGYELVRVQLNGLRRPVLQIMADRADGAGMTVEDCADISRAVSALLDVEDPIQQAYELEVSSPGIDRPLTRRKDFERWAGFDAKLETRMPIDGRKRWRGRLLGLDGEDIRLTLPEGAEARVPLGAVQSAKLVLTDELIAATAAQAAAAANTPTQTPDAAEPSAPDQAQD